MMARGIASLEWTPPLIVFVFCVALVGNLLLEWRGLFKFQKEPAGYRKANSSRIWLVACAVQQNAVF